MGGSIARQRAKLANGNIPYHRHHADFMNAGWPGHRKLSVLLLSRSLNPRLDRISNFCHAANQLAGGEKNCIVYSVFCTFMLIIIIIITIISIHLFVALLNCLYLNPQVLLAWGTTIFNNKRGVKKLC